MQQDLIKSGLATPQDFGVNPNSNPLFDDRLIIDPYRIVPYDSFHNVVDSSGHVPRRVEWLAEALNPLVFFFFYLYALESYFIYE